MNHSLPETTRSDKIKGWLAEHGLSYRRLGKFLGMTDAGARKSLLQDSVPLERYKEFQRFGLPEDLLPKIEKTDPRCSVCARYGAAACDDCNDGRANFMPLAADEPSRELAKI